MSGRHHFTPRYIPMAAPTQIAGDVYVAGAISATGAITGAATLTDEIQPYLAGISAADAVPKLIYDAAVSAATPTPWYTAGLPAGAYGCLSFIAEGGAAVADAIGAQVFLRDGDLWYRTYNEGWSTVINPPLTTHTHTAFSDDINITSASEAVLVEVLSSSESAPAVDVSVVVGDTQGGANPHGIALAWDGANYKVITHKGEGSTSTPMATRATDGHGAMGIDATPTAADELVINGATVLMTTTDAADPTFTIRHATANSQDVYLRLGEGAAGAAGAYLCYEGAGDNYFVIGVRDGAVDREGIVVRRPDGHVGIGGDPDATHGLYAHGKSIFGGAADAAIRVHTTTTPTWCGQAHFHSTYDDDDRGGSAYSITAVLSNKHSTSEGNVRYWGVGLDDATAGTDGDLGFNYQEDDAPWTRMSYLQDSSSVDQLTFTGQHRPHWAAGQGSAPRDLVGRVVVATGTIRSLNRPPGKESIAVSEAIPEVALSSGYAQDTVFGVIAGHEEDGTREYALGCFVTCFPQDDGPRVVVNGLGEGAVWVSDARGAIANGDLLTSWRAGYAVRQPDDVVYASTLGKATMECAFELDSDAYECRERGGGRIAFIACVYMSS